MTKQGNVKRAVRQHARESGTRYTEARAAMAKGKSSAPLTRRVQRAALKAHLEERYGMRITSVTPMDHPGSGKIPSTLLVKRKGEPAWVARVFSSPADKVSRVQGDADILRFLASHDFPAERLAHDDPVSVLDGAGVIVTEFISGGFPIDERGGPEAFNELASLLGRLHSLPRGRGAVARDGGSLDGGSLENTGGFYIGRPKQDVAAAMNMLVSVEDEIAPEGRDDFEWLRDQIENADDAEGLPEALTHGNYVGDWTAVGKPGNLRIIGWAGSGRGPRLPSLAWLLWSAGHGETEFIDAVVRGYREHVQPTDDELDRLPRVINMRPLNMMCGRYQRSVRAGVTPRRRPDSTNVFHSHGGTRSRLAYGEGVAEQAIAAFRS